MNNNSGKLHRMVSQRAQNESDSCLLEGGLEEYNGDQGQQNDPHNLTVVKDASKGSIRDGDFYGRVYRDYKILQPIGQGKFSFVFKAENIVTKQIIALKLLKIFDINDVK